LKLKSNFEIEMKYLGDFKKVHLYQLPDRSTAIKASLSEYPAIFACYWTPESKYKKASIFYYGEYIGDLSEPAKDIYRVASFDEELWEKYNRAEKCVWNRAKPEEEKKEEVEVKEEEEEKPFDYDEYTKIVDEFFTTLGEVKLNWD
jgi:hypothetical protein